MKRIVTLLSICTLLFSANIAYADSGTWSTTLTGGLLPLTPSFGNTMLYQDTVASASSGLTVERTAWMSDSMVFGRFSVIEGTINPGLAHVNAYLYSTTAGGGVYGDGDDFILHSGQNSMTVSLSGNGTDGVWGTDVHTVNYGDNEVKSAIVSYRTDEKIVGEILVSYDQANGLYGYGISKSLLNFDNYTRLSFGGQVWGLDNQLTGFYLDGSSYTGPPLVGTSTPEPASLLIFGLGLVSLPLVSRFRRK